MKRLLIALMLVGISFFPGRTNAQAPFGGLIVFTAPCTCGFTFNYHVFTPLFLGPAPITGTLAAPVTPNTFPFFVLHPGAWALGIFTPGVQACWMYAGWGCFPVPVLGVITPFTGSSP